MGRIVGEGEVAFLDLREAGPFSEGHPFFAVPCPWSRFEERVVALVPRRDVPVILIDGGDGIAELAARSLECLGYSDVSFVEGGVPGWSEAGFTNFKGVHVPSKTLGELAEEHLHPRSLGPDALSQWRDEGRPFQFYDCRPAAEHMKMTVPGTTYLPNGELLHRLETLPAETPIVVTCAGRTRGIIGAASVGLVAPDREIFWLEDGTQGWRLSGRELAHDLPEEKLPALNDGAAAATEARSLKFLAREGLEMLEAPEVDALCSENGVTTYLFDVRAPEEARRDPLPGFAAVPVVSLVQATDQEIGVWRARVILADDLGLRGAIAAYWLRALGFQTFVVRTSDALRGRSVAPKPTAVAERVLRISAAEALADFETGNARLVDVRPSGDFATGHVRGSIWTIRPRLHDLPSDIGRLHLVGDETARADLAAFTLRSTGAFDAAVVDGGMTALTAAGAEIETSSPMPLSEALDITSFADGRHRGNLKASQLYLAWEKGLVGQLSDTERGLFRI
ncbi:rhodanese-like domain-containing protein [Actibacterium pelagium]|nr:rhodanese-like domain-containing protein [Actibacterium pelagium]